MNEWHLLMHFFLSDVSQSGCKETMNCKNKMLSTIETNLWYILVALSRHAVLSHYLIISRLYVNIRWSQEASTELCLTRVLCFNYRSLHHLSLDMERAPTPRVKQPATPKSQKPPNECSHNDTPRIFSLLYNVDSRWRLWFTTSGGH